ncbi:hypothetical protein GGI35DRAFT_152326 [Trichoderma velutinum]
MSFDSSNTTSTASSTIYTPIGSAIAIGNLSLRDDPSDAVPWPGNTYMIREKDSGKLLGTTGCGISLTKLTSARDKIEPYQWLCVETNGYFGFFNKSSNKYMSFVDQRMLHTAAEFGPKEFFLTRRHPNGGYQLLAPASANMLKQVAILSYNHLIMRQHAGIIWEFVQVSEST